MNRRRLSAKRLGRRPRLCFRLGWRLAVALLLVASAASSQAVKGKPAPNAGAPPLTFHGLLPGVATATQVRARLGAPVFEAKWYSYKLYYPAKDRPGLFDVVHLHGDQPDSGLANIEAATVPEGYTTESEIRTRLNDPEYELRMSTWSLLDYSRQGLRFAIDANGRTIGVAYFPNGHPRVIPGERRSIDLRGLRQGPQPAPPKTADLSGLLAGASEVVISPIDAGWLPYPFQIHDDLKARTLVLEKGDLTIALVGADLFGIGKLEADLIREQVARLGVDHLVLASSHNHAAPDTIGVYGHYPAAYIAFLQQRVVAGVRQALESKSPVSAMRSASRELPMDGIRVQGLFRNARNPGVLDPQLALIQIETTASQGVLATVVSFACHVESLAPGAREISADFPGVMADELKRRNSGQVIFLNGAVGGMVSGDNRERTFGSSRAMGLELAERVLELAKTARPMTSAELLVDRRGLEIPVTNQELLPLYDKLGRPLHRGRVPTDMMRIQIGEAELITLPGELLPEVSFEILEEMTGFPRMLVGLANDQLGYLIPPYDFRADAYEESVSQGPAAAVMVRDAALRMLRKQ